MRRGRIIIFLILIVIVGLVVVGVALRQLILPSLTPTPAPSTFRVYYAVQPIPQGEVIKEEHLGFYSLPQEAVAGVMFTAEEKDALVGKVARYPIDPGVIITDPMVVPAGAAVATGGPQWASLIPAGMTAMAIPTTRLESMGYGITDGAHVNVTACMLMVDVDPTFQTVTPNHVAVVQAPANVPPDAMPGVSLGLKTYGDPAYQGRAEVEQAFQQGIYVIPSEAQRPRPVCQMVFQNVTILKLGTFNPAEAAGQIQDQAAQTADTRPPDIITLILSPQDQITLTYLVYTNARLTLSLRNANDQSRLATEATTLQFLLSQYNIPVPVKLPYDLTPRIDQIAPIVLPNDAPPPAE